MSADHVVMDRNDLFCRHCGARQTLIPEQGYRVTEKSMRAMRLLSEDFEECHADCPETDASPSKRAGLSPEEWIRSGDTGISSETIWAALTHRTVARTGIPYDPADFGRCYRLLAHFPHWRPRLGEVVARHPEWAPLVAHWDELTALYEQELPSGNAPKLYARMRELEGR